MNAIINNFGLTIRCTKSPGGDNNEFDMKWRLTFLLSCLRQHNSVIINFVKLKQIFFTPWWWNALRNGSKISDKHEHKEIEIFKISVCLCSNLNQFVFLRIKCSIVVKFACLQITKFNQIIFFLSKEPLSTP